jgi:hypothetical protein
MQAPQSTFVGWEGMYVAKSTAAGDLLANSQFLCLHPSCQTPKLQGSTYPMLEMTRPKNMTPITITNIATHSSATFEGMTSP